MEIKKKRELSDVTITHVSLVKSGQNKRPFFLSKANDGETHEGKADIELNFRVLQKSENAHQLLYGIVYEPDVADTSDDFMTAVEIEKMAHTFLAKYRQVDTEHNLVAGDGVPVESYISLVDMEINGEVIKKGSWVLVVKATNESWQDYLDGKITGYSMFGFARNVTEKTADPEQKTWFKKTSDAILNFLGVTQVEKSFEEEFKKQVSSPSFILNVFENDFYKQYFNSTAPEGDIIALRDAMVGALEYINTLIPATTVEKTNEPIPEPVPEPMAEVIPVAEPEPVPEPVVKSEPAPELTPDKIREMFQEMIAETVAKSSIKPEQVAELVTKGFEEKFAILEKRMDDKDLASQGVATHVTQTTKPKKSMPGI